MSRNPRCRCRSPRPRRPPSAPCAPPSTRQARSWRIWPKLVCEPLPERPRMTPFTRAARIADLEISEIVRLSEKAAALKAAGRDVVSLSTGEPDFPTPPHVVEAAHRAALAGQTRYPATL